MPKMFMLPSPIQLRNPVTREAIDGEGGTVSFRRWFNEAVMGARDVWAGYKALRAANKIEDAIEAAEKGDGTIVLDNEHYELLKKAAESDACAASWVQLAIARQLLPFIDAIVDATDYIAAKPKAAGE